MLGTFILWFCWFGFNAGNAINYNDTSELRPTVMAVSVVNTTLSASTAGVTALLTDLFLTERKTGEAIFNISYAMNGVISGLVAITGGCAVFCPWVSVIIGGVAGLNYLFTSKLLVRWCIDDAVDAIPVHLSNGVWGVLATGLFASREGIERLLNNTDPRHIGWFYSLGEGSNDATFLACQMLGLLVIIVWVLSMMLPFFLGLSYFGMLRSDALEEMVGLDVSYSSGTTSLFRTTDGISKGTIGTDNFTTAEKENDHDFA